MVTRPNPHDAFFRQAFGSPRHVVGLLKLVLPKQLQALLDLDPARIRVLDPTHVDAELRSTGSDLVVEVPRRAAAGDSDRAPAIFILAIEHQRQDERFIVVRQLGYTVRIWERWLREHPDATHLPPVIPIVIHNGERPWRSPTSLHALLDLPDVPLDPSLRALLPRVPDCVAEGMSVPVVREPPSCCPGTGGISCNRPTAQGTCDGPPLLGCGSVCAQCGDGQCGPGENTCNCPADCAPAQ